MSEDSQSATEVLAEIHQHTTQILGYMKSIDYKYSLLLKRIEKQLEENFSPALPPPEEPKKSKVLIQQLVSYPDNKWAPLVVVKIYDREKHLIKETKTNSAGKWTANLDPGEYFIHLLKASVGQNKPKIDQYFSITVESSEKPIELPAQKIEKVEK